MNHSLWIFGWRNLWRNPKRTTILLAVFSLGLGSMLFFQSLMHAWSDSMLENALNNMTDSVQIHHPDYSKKMTVEQSFSVTPELTNLLDALQAEGQIRNWAKRIKVPAMIQSEYERYPVTIIGIEPEKEAKLSFIGDSVVAGHYLTADKRGLLVGHSLLGKLDTKLKRRVVLMGQKYGGGLAELGVRIVGTYRHSDERTESAMVFLPFTAAEKMLGLKASNATQQIAIDINPLLTLQQEQDLISRIQDRVPNAKVSSWRELHPFLQASNEMMDSFIWVWLGFIMVLMVFGMLNTLLMSLYERQKEFVLLHTLGMRPNRLRTLILIEVTFLVALATLIGFLLAGGLVWWGGDGVELTYFEEGAAYFGMGHVLVMQMDIAAWIEIVMVTLIVTILFSLWPIFRATRYQALKIRQ